MSAILLPFDDHNAIDWPAFDQHVSRTVEAGLIPAVNMDTGYAHLLDETTRSRVLQRCRDVVDGSPFLAGALVADQPGAPPDLDSYHRQIEAVEAMGGSPIVFQSFGITELPEDQIVPCYAQLASRCDRFYAFELGTMFAPFGRIYALNTYRELMRLKSCVGAKHSSLNRSLEWERLAVRDAERPEFKVLTGNDLAIDMVIYGSDYLLGLSTFCPDLFARRDRLWEAGDPEFFQLNDTLQYLGQFAFRHPTSAYKHSAAMFLHGRGWIASDRTHERSPTRPASDYAVLYEIGRQLGIEMRKP